MDRLRALIIEDSLEDYEMLVRELKKKYVPETRRVETEAQLESALISSWDVILCDYAIHWKVALKMSQDRMCNVPFIIVSGREEDDSGVEAMQSGVWDVLNKAQITRLPHIVQRELQRAKSIMDYYDAHRSLIQTIKGD